MSIFAALDNLFLHSAHDLLIGFGFQPVQDELPAGPSVRMCPFPLYAKGRMYVTLISLNHWLEVQEENLLFLLKQQYKAQDINLISLWEDQWMLHRDFIELRLKTLQGDFKAIPARKTQVKKVSKETQIHFIEDNHFHIATNSPNRYGLYLKDELVALATFANPRKWNRTEGVHISLELVRFACKSGYIVQGGLSKLLKAAEREFQASDVMTYIDLDWSDGKGFASIGFKEVSNTGAFCFYINPATYERLHHMRYRAELHADWIKGWNAGSLKMVLDKVQG